MLGTLLMAAVLAMPQQDTSKTRISSDTTNMPPDTSAVVDTTGWRMTDSIPVLDTTVTVTPGHSFINEIWDYLITGFGPVQPPVQPPDTTQPPDLTQPPAPPIVVQGPGCADNANGADYVCTVQFQPDVMVDSTYWRRNDGSGSTYFPGDSLQWGYVTFPCTTVNGGMDSRSYRNDIRSSLLSVPTTHVCGGGGPGPTPPPGQGSFSLDFNDGLNNRTLGIYIDNQQDGEQLPYRKHSYVAMGGYDGEGFIRMHWQTDMNIQFSPVSVNIPAPAARHFKLSYQVRQSAQMYVEGSNVKIVRMRFGASGKVGTMLSGSGNNLGFRWTWEEYWRQLDTQTFGQLLPSDNQWHLWEWEYDATDISQLTFRLWVDGVFVGQSIRAATLGDQWSNTQDLTLSIFAEMYSCGPPGCQANINTGDYDIDAFTYTVLP